jgi:hypothetical protein
MQSGIGVYALMFWRNLHRFPEDGGSSSFKTLVPIYWATRRHILGEKTRNVHIYMDLSLRPSVMVIFSSGTVCRAQP